MSDFYSLLQPLLERSKAVYFVFDVAERRVVYASGPYEELTGVASGALEAALPSWLERLHPDDRHYVRQRLAQAAPGDILRDLQLRAAGPNGRTQWLCLTLCSSCLWPAAWAHSSPFRFCERSLAGICPSF